MDEQKQYEIATRLAEWMGGYPATAELVLGRLNNKVSNPNLIDAMWKFILETQN